METKTCSMCNIENKSVTSTTIIQNVKTVIAKKDQNVTMKIKMNYQINGKYTMKKIEMC